MFHPQEILILMSLYEAATVTFLLIINIALISSE